MGWDEDPSSGIQKKVGNRASAPSKNLAYGIAYGSVFAGTFLHEILPESVCDGFAKGATAGKEVGKSAQEKVNEVFSSEPQPEKGPVENNPSFT